MRRAVLDIFPELEPEPFAVAGKGWHSLAVEVGGRLIFKFPEGEEAETALRREVSLLAVVAPRLTLSVPRMSIHEGPLLFSRHDKLVGDTLTAEAFAMLPADARLLLADDLARFLFELHAIDPNAMLAAGALPVELWDTLDETLEPVWRELPAPVVRVARDAVGRYRQLGPDPLGQRYGFFDAHGWNMAFDRQAEKLNGIFDFADSGLGALHREFAPISLIAPELVALTADAYERASGKTVERERVFLLTAAMRLSEFAGALLRGPMIEWTKALVIEWFGQKAIR